MPAARHRRPELRAVERFQQVSREDRIGLAVVLFGVLGLGALLGRIVWS